LAFLENLGGTSSAQAASSTLFERQYRNISVYQSIVSADLHWR